MEIKESAALLIAVVGHQHGLVNSVPQNPRPFIERVPPIQPRPPRNGPLRNQRAQLHPSRGLRNGMDRV
jgi:hypothetical protein